MTKENQRMTCPRPLFLFAVLLFSILLPASVHAATPAKPGWRLQVIPQTTNFSAVRNAECRAVVESEGPQGEHIEESRASTQCDRYLITVRNEGAAATDGSDVVIRQALPAGVTAVSVARGRDGSNALLAPPLTCDVATITCIHSGSVEPNEALVMTVLVEVDPSLTNGTELSSSATVEGGGALPVTTTASNLVSVDSPPFSIRSFSLYANGSDGSTIDQAGGHPHSVTSSFVIPQVSQLNVKAPGEIGPYYDPVEALKDAVVNLPLGFVGNPQAVPACPIYQLAHLGRGGGCPVDTEIGSAGFAAEGPEASGTEGLPVFNLVPEKGYAAEFGFEYLEHEVIIYAEAVHTRDGYGLRVTAPGLPRLFHFLEPQQVTVTFFGNPAERNGSPGPSNPFLSNPADCSRPSLDTGIWADSWQTPGNAVSSGFSTYPEGVTGCKELQFHPSLGVKPTTTAADSPSSLAFDLRVPQNEDVEGLATPPVRNITVAFPNGLVVSPSQAEGLGACQSEGANGINIGSTDISTQGQDFGDPLATEYGAGHAGGNGSPYDDGLWHTAPGRCPAASQIGTVEVTTPLLDHPLPGRVYLGAPECSPCSNADAASGRLIKLYIEINDPKSGVIAKLPGTVKADPSTGQLTAVFADAPQLPFSDFKLHLKEGPRAPLRTPSVCGTYQAASQLEPWSAPETPDASPGDSFQITSVPGVFGCPITEAQLPNAPTFSAGTVTPLAGAFSPFVLKVSRADGSQQINSIDATLPQGLLGRLAGIPYCSEAQIAAAAVHGGVSEKASPSCPATSEVGTVTVAAGPGPTPFNVEGHAYLAGPYKGAPLSLAIITPAVAGPFDLGDVVVRTALYVNESTTQIHAVSDPIPQILAGIPLDVRSIAITMNRPHFILNPTSCDPTSVVGSALSSLGSVAPLAQPFQVGGCSSLPFKPRLALRVFGKTNRNSKPRFRAVLRTKPGEANIRRAQVNLPHSIFLEQSHIRTICTRVQYSAGGGHGEQCPKGSIYGHAKAFTPLLDQPLTGPVYLRSSNHKLPDLVAALGGQIDVSLDGKVDSGPNSGIRNTFELVPDAPVKKFILELDGGGKGLLVNSEDLCSRTGKRRRAIVRFTGQNGKVESFKPKVANSCGGVGKKGRKHRGV